MIRTLGEPSLTLIGVLGNAIIEMDLCELEGLGLTLIDLWGRGLKGPTTHKHTGRYGVSDL